MKITADTNILVRALVGDNEQQSRLARKELDTAEEVVLTLPALCELVWVLRKGYGIANLEIALAIRRLIGSENAVVNRPAVEAGLAILELGGDFADGAIAYEGAWLGGEVLVTFDKQAVKLLNARGVKARLPS